MFFTKVGSSHDFVQNRTLVPAVQPRRLHRVSKLLVPFSGAGMSEIRRTDVIRNMTEDIGPTPQRPIKSSPAIHRDHPSTSGAVRGISSKNRPWCDVDHTFSLV